MWTWLLASALAADPCSPPSVGDCATGALWRAYEAGCALPDGLGVPAALPTVGRPRDGDKVARDAFGVPNVRETDNFAIRWGNSNPPSTGDVDLIAAQLEAAWDHEMEVLGYPGPTATDTYKLNVYVGDTGNGAPSSLGNSGYFWYDDQSYPMLVLAPFITDDVDWSATTTSHELFHAVQDAIGTVGYDANGAWFYEASATWMSHEVHPDTWGYAAFVGAFAMRPALPVDFFDYPDEGTVEEMHQYGAFIFVQHVAELGGGPDIIQDTFFETRAGGDPLRTIEDLLDGEGILLEDAFFSFAARNATWSYDNRDDLLAWMQQIPGTSHREAGTIGVDDGWERPLAHLPHTFGANYWVLELPALAEVSFDGDAGPDAWSADVVLRRGAQHERLVIPLEDGVGSRVLVTGDDVDEAWLVVAAVDGFGDDGDGDTFDYRVRVRPLYTGGGGGGRACGCDSWVGGGGVAGGAWLALVGLLAVRRRASIG